MVNVLALLLGTRGVMEALDDLLGAMVNVLVLLATAAPDPRCQSLADLSSGDLTIERAEPFGRFAVAGFRVMR